MYTDMLVSQGVSPERVVMQGCVGLDDSIEDNGPLSNATESALRGCVSLALKELRSRNLGCVTSVFFGLSCSHYGYATQLWEQALKAATASGLGCKESGIRSGILDPNSAMAQYVFQASPLKTSSTSEVSIRVMSTKNISERTIESIAPWLHEPVAHALRGYQTLATPLQLRGTL